MNFLFLLEKIFRENDIFLSLTLHHSLDELDIPLLISLILGIRGRKSKEMLPVRVDVHGPSVLRANIPPRNFPEWYSTFGVTERPVLKSRRIIMSLTSIQEHFLSAYSTNARNGRQEIQ